VPEEPNLKVLGVTTFNGKDVVAVEGSPPATPPSGYTATTTLYVSTTAPYLPVGAALIVKASSGSTAERQASVFGKYNDPVKPLAPQGATPVTSLTA
jgi:hypothetical protein